MTILLSLPRYDNTSGGIDCQCKLCVGMTPDERATKGVAMHEARRRGGKTRASQPSMAIARRNGFEKVMQTRPEVLLWLKHRIKSHNKRRAGECGITPSEYKKRRQAELGLIYAGAGQ